MTAWLIAIAIATIILTPIAWEIRSIFRDIRGWQALARTAATVPEQELAANDERIENERQDWLWSDVIMSGRDDAAQTYAWGPDLWPPLSQTWCDPGDVDRIDDLVHEWARQQGER